jgi:uncharacterized RDD family membrane protein YckC
MKQWNYAEGDQIKGPIPEDELIQLIQSGRLPKNALVWTEGQQDWSPASEINGLLPPELQPSLDESLPSNQRVKRINNSDFEPSGEQQRPWIRYWARLVDFLLFSLLVGFIIGFIDESILDNTNDTVFGIILLLAYIPVEPLMLMSWGTTPGKFLLNVRLRNDDGSKLSYNQALIRSTGVVMKGQGVGIPLLSLVTHIYAYKRLTNQGITAWDESGDHTVAHKEISGWRALILILILLGFIGLIVWQVQAELPTY